MGVPGSNPGGPINLKAFLPLPTYPINRIGGELRIFSQLQISDGFRVANPTFLNSLEGLLGVQEDGVKEDIGCSAGIGKRYKKAVY